MAESSCPSWIDYDTFDTESEWQRPNIIFIMVDDLGYGDLGCYDGETIPTPNLDQMATEGTRFTNCYAGSAICAPSRSVLMTGQHAGHTRVRNNSADVGGAWINDPSWHGGGRRTVPLTGKDTTVAEVLSDAGYSTGCIGKWGLGDVQTSGDPNKRGFDEFYGYLDQVHAHDYYAPYLIRNGKKEPIPENERDISFEDPILEVVEHGAADQDGVYTHDLLVEESLEFIRENADEDFFLYLPWTLPHGPPVVPELSDFVEEEWSDSEKGRATMVAKLDREVGRLLDCLDAQGIDEETIVFFCSDHGPWRPATEEPFEATGPLRGHKGSLYEGGIRTPMLVRWPGRVPAGEVNHSPWYYPDVLPTCAELAGLEFPLGELNVDTDGLSVLQTLLGGEQALDQRYLYWEYPSDNLSQAARFGDWKAIRPATDEPIELYNLAEDVGETDDRSDEYPEHIHRFEQYFTHAHEESVHWPTW